MDEDTCTKMGCVSSEPKHSSEELKPWTLVWGIQDLSSTQGVICIGVTAQIKATHPDTKEGRENAELERRKQSAHLWEIHSSLSGLRHHHFMKVPEGISWHYHPLDSRKKNHSEVLLPEVFLAKFDPLIKNFIDSLRDPLWENSGEYGEYLQNHLTRFERVWTRVRAELLREDEEDEDEESVIQPEN